MPPKALIQGCGGNRPPRKKILTPILK